MRQELVELQPAAETVGHKDLRVHLFYFPDQPAAQLDRSLVEIPLEPHDSGQPAAIKVSLDRVQLQAGTDKLLAWL